MIVLRQRQVSVGFFDMEISLMEIGSYTKELLPVERRDKSIHFGTNRDGVNAITSNLFVYQVRLHQLYYQEVNAESVHKCMTIR